MTDELVDGQANGLFDRLAFELLEKLADELVVGLAYKPSDELVDELKDELADRLEAGKLFDGRLHTGCMTVHAGVVVEQGDDLVDGLANELVGKPFNELVDLELTNRRMNYLTNRH